MHIFFSHIARQHKCKNWINKYRFPETFFWLAILINIGIILVVKYQVVPFLTKFYKSGHSGLLKQGYRSSRIGSSGGGGAACGAALASTKAMSFRPRWAHSTKAKSKDGYERGGRGVRGSILALVADVGDVPRPYSVGAIPPKVATMAAAGAHSDLFKKYNSENN